ncbi:MAG: hypothetical protein AB8I80_12800, partial [Anaerolineae bacterium]
FVIETGVNVKEAQELARQREEIAYLNARFGRFQSKRVYQVRFARQSLFSGALVVVVAWLQMQRSLSPTLALIVVAVFILTETFLITREAPADGS